MNKFTVFYNDGSQFSGVASKRDWDRIDVTKQIIKLQYLYGNSCVIMEGYDQYNHLREMIGLSQKGIVRILLMGRKEDTTDIIIFDLKNKNIYKEEKPLYEEYGKQILAGWQKGLLNNPKSYFKKIEVNNGIN